jgi:hypothetical protein
MNIQKPTPPQNIKLSRRDRLHALVFAGAALGTTLLTLGAAGPKLPPYSGE